MSAFTNKSHNTPSHPQHFMGYCLGLFSQGICHFLIALRWMPFLMCLRTIPYKRWLKLFLPLINVSFLLVDSS
jgi:hypothetical protein